MARAVRITHSAACCSCNAATTCVGLSATLLLNKTSQQWATLGLHAPTTQPSTRLRWREWRPGHACLRRCCLSAAAVEPCIRTGASQRPRPRGTLPWHAVGASASLGSGAGLCPGLAITIDAIRHYAGSQSALQALHQRVPKLSNVGWERSVGSLSWATQQNCALKHLQERWGWQVRVCEAHAVSNSTHSLAAADQGFSRF